MMFALLLLGQLSGWQPLWTRDEGAGTLQTDGSKITVKHTGNDDWSLTREEIITVTPGDVYELDGDVQVTGKGDAGLSAVTRSGQTVVDWETGYPAQKEGQPRHEQIRFLVPFGVDNIQPRLIGNGPATTTLSNYSCRLLKHVTLLDPATPRITLRNDLIQASIEPANLTINVEDLKARHTWTQSDRPEGLVPLSVKQAKNEVEIDCLSSQDFSPLKATYRIDPDKAELNIQLNGQGALSEPIQFPAPFKSDNQSELILPMNEGVRFKAGDRAVQPQWMVGYSGHGLCMSFWGVQEGPSAMMAEIEEPADFMLRVERRNDLLTCIPSWESEKGQFGYPRAIRYIFFAKGNYVTIAKAHRAIAKEKGLFKTLAQKAKERPALAKLVGAADWWTWDEDHKSAFLDQLQAMGLHDVLWASNGTPDLIDRVNNAGYLSGLYDIYQDVMNPAEFPNLPWVQPEWTTAAWPNDLDRKPDGDWERGWVVHDKQGKDVPCGVCCDLEAIKYAKQRIAGQLKTHRFQARFIDTTTASPWRECYDPNHPMTRRQSRKAKMELLDLVSHTFGQVTGSETGQEAAVPYCDYFEGMMSLGPFREPDAGTDPPRLDPNPSEVITKFQLGPEYRIPLWQLVYGDCTVSYWYWGDFTNKTETLWARRDAFCALYGVPPVYFTDLQHLKAQAEKFKASHVAVTTVAKAVGWSEMVSHRDVTPDRAVQESKWANGCRVVANLGKTPYRLQDGREIPPDGWVFDQPDRKPNKKTDARNTDGSSRPNDAVFKEFSRVGLTTGF